VALALASRFSRMLSFQIKDMEFTGLSQPSPYLVSARILNLVIGNASTVSVQAVSLFGLLRNKMANLFKESYKNMNECVGKADGLMDYGVS
jgi:hypothetical protein